MSKHRTKEARKRQANARKRRAIDYVLNVKRASRCQCGESRPECLDFHHVRDKKFCIMAAASKGVSLAKLKDEIEKCEIICANCHRVGHLCYAQYAEAI